MADIELVIKIPEEQHKRICDHTDGVYDMISLLTIIEKGKPLPKGHGRLIDVKDLKKDLVYMSDFSDAKGVWEEDIDDAETIIEADKESEDK